MTKSFRQQLLAGETLLGTMVTLPSPAVAEVLAEVGFDWLFLDAEHGPLNSHSILDIVRAVGHRTACVVRVPGGDQVTIKKVLDLGVAGIIVPQVNSATQAAEVVSYAKYPPEGIRGVGLARAHGYGLQFQQYVDRANEDTAVIVQAEHIDAVADIEAITQVAGVDGVLIGPYDLSASMGKMGEVGDAEVVEAIAKVTHACRRAQKMLGIFTVTAEAAEPYLENGYTLLVVGVDTMLLAHSARQLRKKLVE